MGRNVATWLPLPAGGWERRCPGSRGVKPALLWDEGQQGGPGHLCCNSSEQKLCDPVAQRQCVLVLSPGPAARPRKDHRVGDTRNGANPDSRITGFSAPGSAEHSSVRAARTEGTPAVPRRRCLSPAGSLVGDGLRTLVSSDRASGRVWTTQQWGRGSWRGTSQTPGESAQGGAGAALRPHVLSVPLCR